MHNIDLCNLGNFKTFRNNCMVPKHIPYKGLNARFLIGSSHNALKKCHIILPKQRYWSSSRLLLKNLHKNKKFSAHMAI